MNTFNWTKALGFGAFLWLIMFALTSALVGFSANINGDIWWGLFLAVIAGLVSYILSAYSNIDSPARAFEYGVTWLVIGIALDLLVTRLFDNSMFTSWQYWLGYALVLMAPWLHLEVTSTSHAPV